MLKVYIRTREKRWGILANIVNVVFFLSSMILLKNSILIPNVFEQDLSLFILFPLAFSMLFINVTGIWIDSFRKRRITPIRVSSYFLYCSYFPSLLSATFTPFDDFMQRKNKESYRYPVSQSLLLMAIGLFKVVFLVAPFHPYLYKGFEAYGLWLNNWESLFTILSNVFFYYFLVSALSDFARGISLFFGIPLPNNFDQTLRAGSMLTFSKSFYKSIFYFINDYLSWFVSCITDKYLTLLKHTLVFCYLLLLNSSIWKLCIPLYALWWLEKKIIEKGIKLPRVVTFTLFYVCITIAVVLWLSPSFHYSQMVLEGLVGLHGIALPDSLLRFPFFHKFSHVIDFCDNSGELGFIGGTSDLYAWTFLGFFVGHLGESSCRMVKEFRPTILTLIFTSIIISLSLIYLYNINFFNVFWGAYV